MRRNAWTVVAAAVVGVLAGCSASPAPEHTCEERDRAAVRLPGTELPVTVHPLARLPQGMTDQEIEAALPPAKEQPSYEDQAMRELMRKTLRMVGAKGEMRPGRCEEHVFAEGEAGDYRCTVRYEDFETVWRVEFSGGSMTDVTGTMSMRSWLVTGLLTAPNVYASYGHASQKEAGLRCDKMPKVFRVEVAKPTRYECQSVFWWCSDGRWEGDRRNVSVGIDAQGDVAFDPRDD